MSDEGSCVTLIFYRINPQWWKEPALNLASAVAQMSNLTHCEISIGESACGDGQTMKHVARVFNDSVGVELVERTGRNPQYTYLSLGCSKAAEQRMLNFARAQVGKPFSNMGMARSLLWPRPTDNKSFYCAELVAPSLSRAGCSAKRATLVPPRPIASTSFTASRLLPLPTPLPFGRRRAS